MMLFRLLLLLTCAATAVESCSAADWPRFRGPNGSGLSSDDQTVPLKWDESQNIQWSAPLPGPGLSSPIIVGDRVVVTCWSGYGTEQAKSAEIEDMRRQVVCLDRASGKILWTHEEPPVLPEEPYRGMFAEHGYASHTPVSDGTSVYVFFGKTGVLALSLDSGQKLWQQSVGTNLERHGWGSASSPVLYDNLVIVPGFIEGGALVALDKSSGQVVWKQEVSGHYDDNWSTPILVPVNDQRTDLVLAVPGEIWGLNPENGKLAWYCTLPGSDSARSSVVARDGIIYATASSRGGGGSLAVHAGGKGDVSESHVVWAGRETSGIGTPVVHGDYLYIVNNQVVSQVDLETGERTGQLRLTAAAAAPAGRTESDDGDEPAAGPGRGYRGGPGGQDYSSPVVAGQQLIYCARSGDMFVVQLGDSMKQLARNSFADDRGEFNATPAVSDGQLMIRTQQKLYCIAE